MCGRSSRRLGFAASKVLESLESRPYFQRGQLDSTFGSGGLVVSKFPVDMDIASVAVQSDGKTVAVGSIQGVKSSDFLVLRYTTAGKLDTSFDGDGITTTDFSNHNDVANDVAIDSQGRIVVVGSSNGDVTVAGDLTNGKLDSSFNGSGRLVTSIQGNAGSVVLQGDGKIVVAGNSTGGGIFIRLTTSGSFDTGFNGNGKISIAGGMDGVSDMSLAPGGKIVIVGPATFWSRGFRHRPAQLQRHARQQL